MSAVPTVVIEIYNGQYKPYVVDIAPTEGSSDAVSSGIVFASFRKHVTVNNYAAAIAAATGAQYKEIKVLVDETDNGAKNNRYLYDGEPGVLDLIF